MSQRATRLRTVETVSLCADALAVSAHAFSPAKPMLQYFRDMFSTYALRARYERLIHERLVQFTEQETNLPVADEAGKWQLAGANANSLSSVEQSDIRQRARKLARTNPHARNILRLLQAYVTGPGLSFVLRETSTDESQNCDLVAQASVLWKSFLQSNSRHYDFNEHARRTWRDGECFVRKFPSHEWPPAERFVDP